MGTVANDILGSNWQTTPVVIPTGLPTFPEAPVSINCRVAVPGLTDQPQVTGRGTNGYEAAYRLKEGVDALLALYAPPPPPTREQRLAQLLTCGLQRAVAKGDIGLVERLAKAAALVLSDAVETTERAQALAVKSQAHPDTWYTVEGVCCSCPDWAKHRADEAPYACKHGIAAYFWRKLAMPAQA